MEQIFNVCLLSLCDSFAEAQGHSLFEKAHSLLALGSQGISLTLYPKAVDTDAKLPKLLVD